MRLRKLIKKYYKLLENYFSLSILQFFNFIIPFITLPYLLKILGNELFGLIMFAFSFVQYFNIFTDFGFNLYAPKEIAKNIKNKQKINEIYSSIYVIKFFIFMISLVILSLCVIFIQKFQNYSLIYFLSMGMVFGQILFPAWFFQGIEEMRYITLLNLMAKSLFAFSIFLFVRSKNMYLFVPLLNSAGFISAGLIGQYIAFRKFGIRFTFLSYKQLKIHFKNSSMYFLSRISTSIYTSSNTFVLGLFAGNIAVANYSIAEKIYIGLQQIIYPITNALYPYISKTKNIQLMKKITIFVSASVIIFCIFIYLHSNFILQLIFSTHNIISSNVLKIFSLAIIFVTPSLLIGYPLLGAVGYHNYVNWSVIYGSIFHILGIFTLIFIHKVLPEFIAFLTLLTEVIVFYLRFKGIKKFNIWRSV
jgi:PST family polysaccharide transporter